MMEIQLCIMILHLLSQHDSYVFIQPAGKGIFLCEWNFMVASFELNEGNFA